MIIFPLVQNEKVKLEASYWKSMVPKIMRTVDFGNVLMLSISVRVQWESGISQINVSLSRWQRQQKAASKVKTILRKIHLGSRIYTGSRIKSS